MKSFKKLTTFSMLSALVLFGLATDVKAEVISNEPSNAEIRFVPGSGAPDVVDPSDPSETYDPEDGREGDPTDEPTGDSGALTLDYVSSVQFGEHEIESGTEVYASETLRPFIQVSDRRGTGEGWSVTASASSFITTTDEETEETENTLAGSILRFSNGEVVSAGNSDDPTPNTEIELSTDGTIAEVVTAPVDTGLGTWINRWFPSEGSDLNNNVILEVPGGAATIDDHTATITWTLADVPGQ